MADLITTDNLIIREFTVDDAPFVYDLVNTPGWKRFIGERHVNDHDTAVNYITTALLSSYTKNGYGGWCVNLTDGNTPIGMCGLFPRDFLELPELGFAFMPAYEGRGYAYESSAAVIGYVKNNLGLKGLYATTTQDNERSQRLLNRCGFAPHGTIVIPGRAEESALFYLGL